MALSRIMGSNTGSIECYGCGKMITEAEACEYWLRPRSAGGSSLESGNVQKTCKECKEMKKVSVNISFPLWLVKKMRRDFGLKDPDPTDNPLTAKGLGACIKLAVHRDLRRHKEGKQITGQGEDLDIWTPVVPVELRLAAPGVDGLDREVMNLRTSLNHNINRKMTKMMAELTEPLNSRLEDLDELIRIARRRQEDAYKAMDKDIFKGEGEHTDLGVLEED